MKTVKKSNRKTQEQKDKISATMKAKFADPNYKASHKGIGYLKSLTKITDEQVEEIIKETTTRLPLGDIGALDLDIEIATRYNIVPNTVAKIRNRRERFSKFPQTLVKEKGFQCWIWRGLKEGEVLPDNKSPKRSNFKKKVKGNKKKYPGMKY